MFPKFRRQLGSHRPLCVIKYQDNYIDASSKLMPDSESLNGLIDLVNNNCICNTNVMNLCNINCTLSNTCVTSYCIPV